MKKFLIVLIIIALAAGILYLGYVLRSRNAAPPPSSGGEIINVPGSNGNQGSGNLPEASFSSLAAATESPVLDYFVDAGKNIVAINPDGGIWKIAGKQTTALSSSTASNLSRASFSPDGKRILVVFGGQTGGQTSIFDVEKSAWQPLPAGVQGGTWGPKGSVLAYFSNDMLSTLDLEVKNAKPKALVRLHSENALLEWPVDDLIFVKEPPSGLVQSSLWSYSLKAGMLAPVAEDRFGLDTKWNKTTPVVGISFTANQTGRGGALSIEDQTGKILKQLGFITLPSKCVFTQASTTPSLVCGVPRDRRPLDLALLPDDYLKKALFTSDDIFSFNTTNGSVQTLFNDRTKNIDAENLKILGNTLYFVNRFDKKLYSLPL